MSRESEQQAVPTLALVLSGGGARAAYQVGVLSALAEQAPDLAIPILTGVSAGAINTVYLASHSGTFGQAVSDLREEWGRLTANRVYAVRPLNLGRAVLRWMANMLAFHRIPQPSLRGLMDSSPLRGFLAACMDIEGIRRNVSAGRLRALALSATRYATGQTVTFVQGAPDLDLWHRSMRVAVREPITIGHLMASAAIPLVFPAVRLGDAFYGDGSVRQTAPLAPAIHLGADRIIAVSMRAGSPVATVAPPASGDYPVAAQVFGLLLHSIFLDTLDADAERLQRLNALLRRLPSGTSTDGLRSIDLLLLRPSRDIGGLAGAGSIQLPRIVRFLVSSIGGGTVRSSDFLSYLMFDPSFTGLLMELGFDDTRARRDEIQRFLQG
jgi:NTE family protein